MEQEKWIKHYSNKHEILLVGEGDFSFAASLARAFGDARNMVATSLDTEDAGNEASDHGCSKPRFAEKQGVWTLAPWHSTVSSATENSTESSSISPTRASPRGKRNTLIEVHRSVVRGFVKSGYEMLRVGGQLHITHKAAYPFSMWDIEKLGTEAGFLLFERAAFDIGDYPGYLNKRGSGCFSNECFPVGASTTFKFIKS